MKNELLNSGFVAKRGGVVLAQNAGKLFESDIKSSVPDGCWLYRLRDNASSFAGGTNTRFTSSNICDYILLDDQTKTLFLIECKSTKSTSVPLSMIRDNQLKGLVEAGKHCLVAGLLINFRNEDNDTFFICINNYINMINSINKKSFNIKDLIKNEAVRVDCEKKRSRWRYDIENFVKEMHL